VLESSPVDFEVEYEWTNDVVGHVFVDIVCEFHKSERLAEVPSDLPREVARTNRQAMAPTPGRGLTSGSQRVWWRLCRGLPDIAVEFGGEHCELIDEGDVEVTKGVLQELLQLRLSGPDAAILSSTNSPTKFFSKKVPVQPLVGTSFWLQSQRHFANLTYVRRPSPPKLASREWSLEVRCGG
jgi:hypothetical protein